MLSKHLDDVSSPVYYIVGTKEFVQAMQKMLKKMKIEKENIIFDNFG